MSVAVGTATHQFEDGSKHDLRVELKAKGAPGYPAAIGEPNTFDRRQIDPDERVLIGGAGQARALAGVLLRLAERLEKRGDL